MTTYEIEWVTRGTFTVEADTPEQAREIANDQAFVEAALNGGWGVEIYAVKPS